MHAEFYEKKGIVSEKYDPSCDHILMLSYYDYSGPDFDLDDFVNNLIIKRRDMAKVEPSLTYGVQLIQGSEELPPLIINSSLIMTNYGLGDLVTSCHYANESDMITVKTISDKIEVAWEIHNLFHEELLKINEQYYEKVVREILLTPNFRYEAIETGRILNTINIHKEYLQEHLNNQKNRLN